MVRSMRWVGLQVKLKGMPPPERISPDLRVLTDTTFDVPPEWREWLGSIRADQVEGSNLFLVSKLESTTPGVLDGENQSLQQRVRHFYAGAPAVGRCSRLPMSRSC